MPLTIAKAMPRKQWGTTGFGDRLQSIRKARAFIQVQLAEGADTTQRASSCYGTDPGFPRAPAVIVLPITTDELLA